MNPFNHISGKYFSAAGAEIYYEETGATENPVLLLLHGGFGNLEDFNTIISLITGAYRVIGIDSRGQGKSTLGNTTLSYELLQSDIESLLKHLNISELNIIGISDGGIVAYRLACFTKLKINKLITIGSRWHSRNAIETKEILGKVTVGFWKERHPQMIDNYEALNPAPDFEKLTTQLVDMWLTESSYPNENVKNITADTLIIRGDRDNLIKRKFVFELAEKISNANLSNIAFAGHLVYTEAPEILMTTINKFLQQ